MALELLPLFYLLLLALKSECRFTKQDYILTYAADKIDSSALHTQ